MVITPLTALHKPFRRAILGSPGFFKRQALQPTAQSFPLSSPFLKGRALWNQYSQIPKHGIVAVCFKNRKQRFFFFLVAHWLPVTFHWFTTDGSSIASPICQEGQSERNFPIFAFSSRFFLFFPDFPRALFPDFWQIFRCQGWYSAPLATHCGYATDRWDKSQTSIAQGPLVETGP